MGVAETVYLWGMALRIAQAPASVLQRGHVPVEQRESTVRRDLQNRGVATTDLRMPVDVSGAGGKGGLIVWYDVYVNWCRATDFPVCARTRQPRLLSPWTRGVIRGLGLHLGRGVAV